MAINIKNQRGKRNNDIACPPIRVASILSMKLIDSPPPTPIPIPTAPLEIPSARLGQEHHFDIQR